MPGHRELSPGYRTEPYFMVGSLPDHSASLFLQNTAQFTVFHNKSIKTNTKIQIKPQLRNILPVEETVACGFGEVADGDVRDALEVGNGAGDFDDAIVCSH